MRRLLGTVVLVCLIGTSPTRALGGMNAGGQAYLSWDLAGNDTVLTTSSSQVPLLLHLRNAPDVRVLAAKLIWSSSASADPCYTLVAADPPDTSVLASTPSGWVAPDPPTGNFEGDNTYTWSIHFASSDATHNCVAYLFSVADCDTATSGEFEIASVAVIDGNGQVDTLAVLAGARLQTTPVPPLGISQIWPTAAEARVPVTLNVRGHGFNPNTRLFLRNHGHWIQATSVAIDDTTALRADVVPDFGVGVTADVVVDSPRGSPAVLPNTLTETENTTDLSDPNNPIRPTNEGTPFTQIDVKAPTSYSNGVPPSGGQGLSFNVHPGYPDSLASPTLRVTRSGGDTVAVVYSQPAHGVGFSYWLGNGAGASYMLPTPVYATMVGTLLEGSLLFTGSGTSNDKGKILLTGSASYVQLDTTTSVMQDDFADTIGTSVRNWTSGSKGCSNDTTNRVLFYDAALSDTAAIPVLPATSALHYDFQTHKLSPSKRTSPISQVSFATPNGEHSGQCLGYYNRTSGLFGVVLWSNYQCTSPFTNDTMMTVSQHDQRWRTTPYGGRYGYGQLLGTDSTIDTLGCGISCFAALHSFYNQPTTPDSLNAYLQRKPGGYMFFEAVRIDTVRGTAIGDTLTFKWAGHGVWPSWSKYVVVGTQTNDSVYIRIKLLSGRRGGDGAITNYAVIDTVYQAITADALHGKYAGRFSLAEPTIATKGYSQGRWHLKKEDQHSTSADTVEAALRAGTPVMIWKKYSAKNEHEVVAKGQKPGWPHTPDGPKGTYSIMDPDGYLTLLEGYGNSFSQAVRAVLDSVPAHGPQATPVAAEAGEPILRGLDIIVDGTVTLRLVDPLGRALAYDASGSAYTTNIPGCSVLRGLTTLRGGDSASVSPPYDVITIDEAMGGTYSLALGGSDSSQAGITVQKYDTGGYVNIDCATVPVTPSTMVRYNILHQPTGALALQYITTTGVVPQVPRDVMRLDVTPNPMRGAGLLSWVTERAGLVDVALFDVEGRRVCRVASGVMSAGRHSVAWRDVSKERDLVAGLYFVRLVSCGRAVVRRVVVLGGR